MGLLITSHNRGINLLNDGQKQAYDYQKFKICFAIFKVIDLPGMTFDLGVKHYSGYLNAGTGDYLHYWFEITISIRFIFLEISISCATRWFAQRKKQRMIITLSMQVGRGREGCGHCAPHHVVQRRSRMLVADWTVIGE